MIRVAVPDNFVNELIEYLEYSAYDKRRDLANGVKPEALKDFVNGEAWAYEAILAWVRRAIDVH